MTEKEIKGQSNSRGIFAKGSEAYVAFNLGGHLLKPLRVPHVALVIGNAPRLGILQLLRDVENGNSGAAHTVDLGDQQPQATSATGDDDDLLGEVDLAMQAVRELVAKLVEERN